MAQYEHDNHPKDLHPDGLPIYDHVPLSESQQVVVTVPFTPDDLRTLQCVARAFDTNVADLIREAVAAHLRREFPGHKGLTN